MLEMASLGSKVLQIRSVEFAGKYQVPLRVLSSFDNDEDGAFDEEFKRTWAHSSLQKRKITWNSQSSQVSRLTVTKQN